MHTRPVILILLFIITSGCRQSPDNKTDAEPADPKGTATEVWDNTDPGLNALIASTNLVFERNKPPLEIHDSILLKAWKGETVHAQLAVWSKDINTPVRIDCKASAHTAIEPEM